MQLNHKQGNYYLWQTKYLRITAFLVERRNQNRH